MYTAEEIEAAIAERKAIHEKALALALRVSHEDFAELPPFEQRLLEKELAALNQLLSVHNERTAQMENPK